MSRQTSFARRISIHALGLAALATACSDPFKTTYEPIAPEGEEVCESSDDWLPTTPELPQFLPVPHPAGECPFYRSGWQNFLRAMQPDAQGRPALVSYPTIDQVFHFTKPHSPNRSFLGDVKQAGGRQILIDANGNSLYYGIHVNDAFRQFILDNGLETAAALRNYPTNPATMNLVFPPGVVEFKSAWQIVEPSMVADSANFITMETTVPTLSQSADGTVHEDRNVPRTVTVRLLAIHVVSTLVGHPEFVWASFEHSTAPVTGETDTGSVDLQRDVAPILLDDKNPDPSDPSNLKNATVVSDKAHILYKAGVKANEANKAFDEKTLRLVNQKFMNMDGSPAQTSIYRMFPASKSNTIDADAAITSLNHNVEQLFKKKGAGDKRVNYRLLGAQWMDKPRYFEKNIPIQNDKFSPMVLGPHISQDGQLVPPITEQELTDAIIADGSDSEFSILAGEDRMSSTAMESFTQAPGNFNNCFTCHNTQAITTNGIPTDRDARTMKLLDPGLLNVSHILSQFLLEEYEDSLPPAP